MSWKLSSLSSTENSSCGKSNDCSIRSMYLSFMVGYRSSGESVFATLQISGQSSSIGFSVVRGCKVGEYFRDGQHFGRLFYAGCMFCCISPPSAAGFVASGCRAGGLSGGAPCASFRLSACRMARSIFVWSTVRCAVLAVGRSSRRMPPAAPDRCVSGCLAGAGAFRNAFVRPRRPGFAALLPLFGAGILE